MVSSLLNCRSEGFMIKVQLVKSVIKNHTKSSLRKKQLSI